MNNLSWMIYAADVAGSVSTLCTIAVGIGLVAVLAQVIWGGADFLMPVFGDDKEKGKKRLSRAGSHLVAVGVFAIAASFIPSTSTIYAIAASEMGEDVLNSETGGKAMQALDAWLDRQIAGTEQEQDQ